jgi:hypothetical protein
MVRGVEFHVCPCSAYGVPASPVCHKGFRFEADMKGNRPKDLGRGGPIDWNSTLSPSTLSGSSFRTTSGSSGGGRLVTSRVREPSLARGIIPVWRPLRPEGLSRAFLALRSIWFSLASIGRVTEDRKSGSVRPIAFAQNLAHDERSD